MNEELRRLIRRAERIARTGDRLSAAFATQLAQVWRRFERGLAAEVSTATAADVSGLLIRVRRVLRQAGFDALAEAIAPVAVGRMSAVIGTRGLPRADLETRLRALRDLAAGSLLAQGDDAAASIWRGVVQHVLSDRPAGEILRELADSLDREERHIRTLFDTQVSIYGRQVEAAKSEALPADQPYLFVGPVDDRTREFCLSHVGKVYTRDQIRRLNNGQLPDVFVTGGGYNCRHSFLAVESRELRGLSNTGDRAPGYDPQVEHVEKRKRRPAA